MSEALERFIESKKENIKYLKQEMINFPSETELNERQIGILEREIRVARDPSEKDIKERSNVIAVWSEQAEQTIKDDAPVFFHGVKSIGSVEPIIESGHLGYLKNEKSGSFTPPGNLDVTTRKSCFTAIEGYTGLNGSKFLPAGAMFVLVPKDEKEYNLALKDGCQSIKTVDFRKNNEQLLAIVTTKENLNYIRGILEKSGYSSDMACSFENFFEVYNKYRKNEIDLKKEYLSEKYSQRYPIELKTGRKPKESLEDFCSHTPVDYNEYRDWRKNKNFTSKAEERQTTNAPIRQGESPVIRLYRSSAHRR